MLANITAKAISQTRGDGGRRVETKSMHINNRHV
jgi:hypothetical protein